MKKKLKQLYKYLTKAHHNISMRCTIKFSQNCLIYGAVVYFRIVQFHLTLMKYKLLKSTSKMLRNLGHLEK